MKQKECDDICEIMYKIRDRMNDNDALTALSLANDLYFNLLRITIQDGKINCEDCK